MRILLCDESHIAYLLAAATHLQERAVRPAQIPFWWETPEGERHELRRDNFRRDNFREVGQMLLEENVRAWGSDNSRIDFSSAAMPRFHITGADVKTWVRLESVEIIRSAHGYMLNCRGTGFKKSEARRFVKKLVKLATWELPGYSRSSPGAPHLMEDLMELRMELRREE